MGDWVEGQTGAFEVEYYRSTAFLTISNMLAHQMLLGAGLSQIYEIGPIYRAEHPQNRRRLSEFTMVDLSRSFVDLPDLLADVEGIMRAVLTVMPQAPSLDEDAFPQITHADVLRAVGLDHTAGSQLPAMARHYLAATFPAFVWVTGFPERTRPFFVRSENGECIDAQLWYRGVIYLAAGGERETSVDEMQRRIMAEGKDPERYEFFLKYLRSSLPRSVGMGFGLERLLGVLTSTAAAGFSSFPTPIGRLLARGQNNDSHR